MNPADLLDKLFTTQRRFFGRYEYRSRLPGGDWSELSFAVDGRSRDAWSAVASRVQSVCPYRDVGIFLQGDRFSAVEEFPGRPIPELRALIDGANERLAILKSEVSSLPSHLQQYVENHLPPTADLFVIAASRACRYTRGPIPTSDCPSTSSPSTAPTTLPRSLGVPDLITGLHDVIQIIANLAEGASSDNRSLIVQLALRSLPIVIETTGLAAQHTWPGTGAFAN